MKGRITDAWMEGSHAELEHTSTFIDHKSKQEHVRARDDVR